MKRWILLLTALCLFGCTQTKDAAVEASRQTPRVLIGKYTYYWTGIEVKELPERGVSGRIRTVVPASAMPEHPNEANFEGLDAPYIYLDDGVALLMNGQWIFFKPE